MKEFKNRYFQELKDKKETVLGFLGKANWTEIAELSNENQNILMSHTKGRSAISKKAKEVLKSWGLKVGGKRRQK